VLVWEERQQGIEVMQDVDYKGLSSEQARRMELVVRLLELCSEPDYALEIAERG